MAKQYVKCLFLARSTTVDAINILKLLPTHGRVWHGEPCYGLNWNPSAYCLAWRSAHLFIWLCVCFLFVYCLFACFYSGVLMGMEMNWIRHIALNFLGTQTCSRLPVFTIMIGRRVLAKSLQSCPTLCDPIDGSPTGSPVPGMLQARTLEWVAISFSNAWKWKVKEKSLLPT